MVVVDRWQGMRDRVKGQGSCIYRALTSSVYLECALMAFTSRLAFSSACSNAEEDEGNTPLL